MSKARKYTVRIDTLNFSDQRKPARALADEAVAEGVWRDPNQRPVHFDPALPGAPVHDVADYPEAAFLEAHCEVIRSELDAWLDGNPDRIKRLTPILLIDPKAEREAWVLTQFPATIELLERLAPTLSPEGLAAISMLQPGQTIPPHCGPSNRRIRIHLGLRGTPGAELVVADKVLRWREGRCLVFDDSYEHEVRHTGDATRIVLIVDVLHRHLLPSR